MFFILLFIALPGLIIFIDFIGFMIKGRSVVGEILLTLAEIGSLIILPFTYADFGQENMCCGDELDTAAFSPQHQLSIFALMIFSLGGYIYSKFRMKIAPPAVEVLLNTFILIGTLLSIVMSFHATETFYILFGSVPVILLGVMMLIKNNRLFLNQNSDDATAENKNPKSIAWRILSAKPFIKYPILLILCLPVLLIITSFLLLLGQKPDSIIRAFTDTYKHGLSQWDYKCDNVKCGGHFLCSVAAKGHKKLVRPQRFGIRNGGRIICTRQLLISNAFEDLIQEKFPSAHKIIRGRYNNVGKLIHRYYYIFNIRIISDIIYCTMKPLEWIFLLTLYTFDRKPENRIARQYVSDSDKLTIDRLLILRPYNTHLMNLPR